MPGNSCARVDNAASLATEDQRRFAAVQIGQLALEQQMDVAVAGDVLRAADPGSAPDKAHITFRVELAPLDRERNDGCGRI